MKSRLERFLLGEKEYSIMRGISGVLVPFSVWIYLYKEMDASEDFLFRDLAARSQAYIDIATFLNDGRRISIESIESEPTLTKYPVRNGVRSNL